MRHLTTGTEPASCHLFGAHRILWATSCLLMILTGACSSKGKDGPPAAGAPDKTATAPVTPPPKAGSTAGMTPDSPPDPGKTDPAVAKAAPAGLPGRAKTPNSALIEYEKTGHQPIPAPVVVLAKSVEGKDAAALVAGDFEPMLRALATGLSALSTKAGDPGEVFSKVFPGFKPAAENWKTLPARATVSVLELQDQAVLGLLVRVTPEGFRRCAEDNTAREGFFGVFVTASEAGPRLTVHEFDKLEPFDGFDAVPQVVKLPNPGGAAAIIAYRTGNIEKEIQDKVTKGLYCKPGSDPSEFSRSFHTVFVFENGMLQAMRTLQATESSTTVGRTTEYRASLSWFVTGDGLFLMDTVVEHNSYPDTTGESDDVRIVCSRTDYLFDAGGNGLLRQLTPGSVEKLRAIKDYEKVSKAVELADAKGCAALLKK